MVAVRRPLTRRRGTMTELISAPAAFARIRSAICGEPARSSMQALWLDGGPPSGMVWEAGANDNLKAFQPLDLAALAQAIEFVAPDTMDEYKGWYARFLTFAGEIARRPEAEAELRALAHRLSRRATIYGSGTGHSTGRTWLRTMRV